MGFYNALSDRDWHEYIHDHDATSPNDEREMTCADCLTRGFHGFTFVGSTAKTLCGDCRKRRGDQYLFDSRSWAQIEAEQERGAA